MPQPHIASSAERSQGLADPADARVELRRRRRHGSRWGWGHDVVADGLELLINLEHRGRPGGEEHRRRSRHHASDARFVLSRSPTPSFRTPTPSVRSFAPGRRGFATRSSRWSRRRSIPTISRSSSGGTSRPTTTTSAKQPSTPNRTSIRSSSHPTTISPATTSTADSTSPDARSRTPSKSPISRTKSGFMLSLSTPKRSFTRDC